jgi:hypothetical protein
MSVTLAEAKIGRVPQPRGFVMGGASLLSGLRRLVDAVDGAITDCDRCGRALYYRRAGTTGEEEQSCDAGEVLLPDPNAAYLPCMSDINKHSQGRP